MHALKNIVGILLGFAAIAILIVLINYNTAYGTGSTAAEKNVRPNAFSDSGGSSKQSSSQKESSMPQLSLRAEAAIAVNADTGKILYEKNMHERLYPASLTKLMTAILLSENRDKTDVLTYSAQDQQEPSNKIGFPTGSRITADSAMKGMLIFSANDFAAMVAENISGSVSSFTTLMNKKAALYNMQDTHFNNANGLPDSNHYSSAYDISVLARQAYRDPWIMDTLEMPSAQVVTAAGKGIKVYNTNQTLDKNGCFAGKTGHTDEAGYCLAAFYRRSGHTYIGVVMKAPDETSLYEDMDALSGLF